LRHCQAVFEEAEDVVLLGEVFRARARVRAALNRPADALTMAEAALRDCYEGSSPESLAGAHDALVEYLGASGRSGREVMAHRTAAVLLRAAAVHAEQGATVIEVSDVLEYGPELYPKSLEELVELVERTPGVRFELMLTAILPDPDDQ